MTNNRATATGNFPSEFDGTSPVEGLEHLGRAIVDANGVPSGSPANYEYLRGVGETAPTQEDMKRVVDTLKAEFPKP